MIVRFVCFWCASFALASLVSAQQATRPASSKKLIEFGWDEPDTAYMRLNIAEMEKTPFDGTVFHVNYAGDGGKPQTFMSAAWGKRAFTMSELQPALDDLKATPFKSFTHNFHRFNVTPGDVDWFDDAGFAAVVRNARLAARIAKEGKARGVLFDIEQYAFPLFDYPKQRDVATKSWDLYAKQVRLRGREIMKAFQDGYPDLHVLMTFAYSLPLSYTSDGTPIDKAPYGLLAPFLDGMLDAARGESKIIDGFEISYDYKDDAQFDDARKHVLGESGQRLCDNRKQFANHLSLAFGLWLDHDSGKRGWFPDDPTRNTFTPQQFEHSVHKALATSDEYVWIYTERAKWWGPDGKPDKLPQSYADAVRRAKAD